MSLDYCELAQGYHKVVGFSLLNDRGESCILGHMAIRSGMAPGPALREYRAAVVVKHHLGISDDEYARISHFNDGVYYRQGSPSEVRDYVCSMMWKDK